MDNKKGLVGFLAVLIALIIGVVLGAAVINIMNDSNNPPISNYDSNNYDNNNYDNQNNDYDDNYDDPNYDNYDTSYDDDYDDYDNQDFPDYYSDTPDRYQDQPLSGSKCGYFDLPCCEGTIEKDPWGGLYVANRCLDSELECRAGYCVEGPTYEAYDRNANYP